MTVVTSTIPSSEYDKVVEYVKSCLKGSQVISNDFDGKTECTIMVINWTNVITMSFSIVNGKRKLSFLYNTGLRHNIQEGN